MVLAVVAVARRGGGGVGLRGGSAVGLRGGGGVGLRRGRRPAPARFAAFLRFSARDGEVGRLVGSW